MNAETSTGALQGLQTGGQDTAKRTETTTRTDRPSRRQGEGLAVVWPYDSDAVGRRVEGAAREGLTAPEMLTLALTALLGLGGIGSMLLVLAII